ncbi:MAG: arylesterase [Betaproteobacteria bacterium]|nr:arylesterase [Betaproteobacteria bacterium]
MQRVAAARSDGTPETGDGAQARFEARTRVWFRAGKRLAVLGALFFATGTAFAQAAKPTVLIFGDSLSAAYGLDARQGWPALLAEALAPRGAAVVNASISGETTQGGRERLPAELKRHQPRVVVIALGGNDGLRGWPVAQTRANLAAMVQAAKAAKARVVLAGMQIPPNYGLDYARDFQALFADLAKRENVVLVPFLLEGIAERFELFQADKIHPTAAAQPMILKNVQPAVARALQSTGKAP